MQNVDLIIKNAAQLLTMKPVMARGVDGDDDEALSIGVIVDGAVAIRADGIVAIGRTSDILAEFTAESVIDAEGQVVAPGLVDPHTHLVFAGARHREYGMRMRGATYHEILSAGGGIHSTVRATRQASVDELVALARPRLQALLDHGVTTVEIKSGYGLDTATELKMLEAIDALRREGPSLVVPTFLGAHVIPLEYRERREAYVSLVVEEMIPQVAQRGLAAACDVFLDEGAYTREEAARILEAAAEHGLRPKIHAGQFSDQGGPQLVSELGGLSADHLELVSDEGVRAMAERGVVANLLPGAAFSLRDHFPSGRRLIDAGVKVAIATDDNPGTSRTENLPLMGAMAVTQMGLTCGEAWQGMTCNGAYALGLEDEIGHLDVGFRADVAIFDIPDFRSLFYHFGVNHLAAVVVGGKLRGSGGAGGKSTP